MKIVHIGDSDGGGGAANAMARLHHALQRAGVDSRMLVRKRRVPQSALETIATRGDADDLFATVGAAVVHQYVQRNRTARTNTHFSLHIDGADLSRTPFVASADVVHLHWTATFQTPTDVRALLDAKPVVWTLHDLEPLTGGCHFPAGCDGYVRDCAGCPQLAHDPFRVTSTTLRDKQALWAQTAPVFIAPSHYMAECARRSAVAQRAEASIVHIPSGIEIETFRPRSKAAARRTLGLPIDGQYVLCGSNHNSETRKGAHFLNRILAAVTVNRRRDMPVLRLLTVGEPKLDFGVIDDIDVIDLGRVSVDTMQLAYAAADVFLHPSVEDNLPLMLLEALSCGTPAIAFDVGGVAEIVRDGINGNIVAAGDDVAMAAALCALLTDGDELQSMSERARAHIEEQFSDVAIARRHSVLYAQVLDTRRARQTSSRPVAKAQIDEVFPRWSSACLVQELADECARASDLTDGLHARSTYATSLESEAARLTTSLADQSRQVHEKDAELAAVYAVAEERGVLLETLHDKLLQRIAQFSGHETTIEEQHAEITFVHGVASDRERRIEEQHAEIELIHHVASDRARRIEQDRALIAEQHAEIELIHHVASDRERLVTKQHALIEEQSAEIVLVHRVASDRERLLAELQRAALERSSIVDRSRKVARLIRTRLRWFLGAVQGRHP